jgi:hypothetical protein
VQRFWEKDDIALPYFNKNQMDIALRLLTFPLQ